jgi:hypothetical protein
MEPWHRTRIGGAPSTQRSKRFYRRHPRNKQRAREEAEHAARQQQMHINIERERYRAWVSLFRPLENDAFPMPLYVPLYHVDPAIWFYVYA